MPDQAYPSRPEVSANHRRVISVRIQSLEESCLQLLDLFRPMDSILSSRSALPKENENQVERLAEKLRSIIDGMKSELALERNHQDAGRAAAALLSNMAVNVEELLPRHLKGYGKVPDSLARYLEIRIDELLDILREIERAIAKSPSKVGPDSPNAKPVQ